MKWHSMNCDEVAKIQMTDSKKGLSNEEAAKRALEQGKNCLEEKKKTSLLVRFLLQMNDFMVIILLVAAGVSFLSTYLRGENDYIDPIIILVIVVLNAVLGIVQESRAEKALEALKKMSAPMARVIRQGLQTRIKAEDLVTGDLIILETGDYVPADARLVHSNNLKTDESSLTGESLPVEKNIEKLDKDIGLGDKRNMVFSGTTVSDGRGMAIVVNTGMSTEVGKIAHLIMSEENNETELQKELAGTGKILGIGALCICFIIFVIGILRNHPAWDMFMTSVSLAVAAIPEGLPAIVTIMLAIGVQRMSKKNAVIRKLPAVETLGGTSVICSDKTGTLTQNKMTVVETFGEQERLMQFAALCNNSTAELGLATERALVIGAKEAGIDKEKLDEAFPRVYELPFDSKRKLMTTVHRGEEGYLVITKGAPERVLSCCKHFGEYSQSIVEKKNEELTEAALRVIGVAYKRVTTLEIVNNKIKNEDLEQNLTFLGLIGMVDPPRKEVSRSVKICKEAGIKPVMITGDHIGTATAIAKKIGILDGRGKAMSGTELSQTSQEDLTKKIYDYSVFARVTPEDKVRIVKAFQARGAIVAMTGDGVNDAPALKTADIGCAMGLSGTDVAKGAADMVLADDNFSTIVAAIKEGRGIYSNIRKAVHFLLSSNIGEIITIFTAILMGWSTPLLAIHLLWVNLVTDSLPAVALGLDPSDASIMKKRPFDRHKSLFSEGLWIRIFLEGLMIGTLALLAFSAGSFFYDFGPIPYVGRTMAFATLSISQLIHAFNMRSEGSLFNINLLSNPYLIGALIVGTLLQVSVIVLEPLSKSFKVVPLNFTQWLLVASLSLVPLLVVELQKMLLKEVTVSVMNKKALQAHES